MPHARTLIRVCLLLVIFQSVSCIWPPSPGKKERVCKTPECVETGREFMKNIDSHVNPCHDFFNFACGNWHKNHPGPKYGPYWSVLDLLSHRMYGIIRKILESDAIEENERNFVQAKWVYETCMKIPDYPMKEASEIAKEIRNVGRYPDTPLWELHNKYLELTGESALFGSAVLGHKVAEGIPVLLLIEVDSAYGSIYHSIHWTPAETRAYTEYLFFAVKSLQLEDSDTQIRERIERVLDFRQSLNQITRRNKQKKPNKYSPLELHELENWFLEIVPQPTKTQDIPWEQIVNILFHSVPEQIRASRSIVSIRHEAYFRELMELLKDVPEEVLASHMEIYFVESHLILKEQVLKLLEMTSINSDSPQRYIREKYIPKWQVCLHNHNMVETLEKLAFEKWFPQSIQKSVHMIIANIKTAMAKQMKSSTWLNNPTYLATKKKLDTLEEWIGFPIWYYKRSVPPVARNKHQILTPNASLNNKKNLLNIHATLLLSPLFNSHLPALYNFAGIGYTIGHELYHTIHECGSYHDGERNVIWWPDDMRLKCISRKTCFVEEYNKLTDREFKQRYNLNVKSDTSITFLENYPDVMGLQAAFDAYQELYKVDKNVCQVFPDFKDFTCDQMFFITFANTLCAHNSKKSAQEKLHGSHHSIESIRVNAAVSHSEDFTKAFGCSVGWSLMNPERRCNIWK